MTHGFVKKLHELFRRKKEEIYERNAQPNPFGDRQLVEFNAWQDYLRSTLSLEVIDIEEGERPGLVPGRIETRKGVDTVRERLYIFSRGIPP
jgi:hypothetical protein